MHAYIETKYELNPAIEQRSWFLLQQRRGTTTCSSSPWWMHGGTRTPALLLLLFLLLLPLLLFTAIRCSSLELVASSSAARHGHKHELMLPPSPPGKLPIIGHLHLLAAGSHQLHVLLRDLAARHGRGGLLLLRLGAVVVSSPRAAEAVLRTHDHVFASRPPSPVAGIIRYGPEGKRLLDMIRDQDLSRMPYLKATVKETLRLHPPAPFLLPHFSTADCEIHGCSFIPSGTRVIVNAWALGRDPASWERAEEFLPERFLQEVHIKGKDLGFVPFGSGRRICPGANFGIATVEIMLANLMYHFDWELQNKIEGAGVDMAESFGLTLRRKEKLFLVPKAL